MRGPKPMLSIPLILIALLPLLLVHTSGAFSLGAKPTTSTHQSTSIQSLGRSTSGRGYMRYNYARINQPVLFAKTREWRMATTTTTRPNVTPRPPTASFLVLHSSSSEDDTSSGATQESSSSPSLWKRIRNYFSPPDDGLTFRQRLAKMGLAAVLSYGWVSNMSYSVSVSLAWYIFSKRTGMSPLAPGQWKGFLAVYAGFFVFNNFVRPIRFAAAMAISPQFENVVNFMQNRFRVSKTAAVGITVFLANVVGTLTAMATGILLASIASGVPVWAK